MSKQANMGNVMQSFLLSTLPYTTLLPPLLLALVLRPLSLNTINYLPSGPTASIFALLAQYYVIIPHTFRYRLSTSSPQSTPTNGTAQTQTQQPDQTEQQPKKSLSLLLSNKSPIYLLASQLALSQFPYMLLPAATGWFIGLAWRGEFLPFVRGDWRVPAWVVGEREMALGRGVGGRGGAGDGEGYEDLRRRLEGEVAIASASASGVGQRQSDGFGNGSGQRQRVR